MVLSRWNSLAALALASAGLGGLSACAEDEAAPAAEPIEIIARVAADEGTPVPVELAFDKSRFAFVAEGADEASPYWIGVQLEPPTDILKQHLRLEGGMVAVHVYDDSPAAKAGLKANDIILKAGDGYIIEPGDLLKSVGAAKESELTLLVIRGGKEQAIKVVPAKRPQQADPQAIRETVTEEREVVRNLEGALNYYRKRAAGGGEAQAVDVLRLRPGVMSARVVREQNLPKDVSVTITKEGSSPAKIVVKKDGKEYETTEDKLHQLPEEVRGYVQLVRSGGGDMIRYATQLVAPQAAPVEATRTATPRLSVPVPTPAVPYGILPEAAKVYRYHVEAKHATDENSKLDQILKIVSQKEDSNVADLRKEVQQLRKELEDLRKEKK